MDHLACTPLFELPAQIHNCRSAISQKSNRFKVDIIVTLKTPFGFEYEHFKKALNQMITNLREVSRATQIYRIILDPHSPAYQDAIDVRLMYNEYVDVRPAGPLDLNERLDRFVRVTTIIRENKGKAEAVDNALDKAGIMFHALPGLHMFESPSREPPRLVHESEKRKQYNLRPRHFHDSIDQWVTKTPRKKITLQRPKVVLKKYVVPDIKDCMDEKDKLEDDIEETLMPSWNTLFQSTKMGDTEKARIEILTKRMQYEFRQKDTDLVDIDFVAPFRVTPIMFRYAMSRVLNPAFGKIKFSKLRLIRDNDGDKTQVVGFLQICLS